MMVVNGSRSLLGNIIVYVPEVSHPFSTCLLTTRRLCEHPPRCIVLMS